MYKASGCDGCVFEKNNDKSLFNTTYGVFFVAKKMKEACF